MRRSWISAGFGRGVQRLMLTSSTLAAMRQPKTTTAYLDRQRMVSRVPGRICATLEKGCDGGSTWRDDGCHGLSLTRGLCRTTRGCGSGFGRHSEALLLWVVADQLEQHERPVRDAIEDVQ